MGNDRGYARAVEQALALHRSGRPAAAEAQYRSILEREPRHFDALHLFGLLRHQQGRHADALDLIRNAIEADPGSLAALSNYGMVLHHLGRHEEALAAHRKALALAPDNADVLMNYAAALAALARHDEALASFDKVLAINPHDAEALFNRGLALLRLRRFAEATASYDQALALNPRDAEALTNRGIALQGLRRHNAAISSFDAALALDPNYAAAHFNKANALADLDRLTDALASYDKALAVKPQYADALVYRGAVLAKLNRHREAVASYRQGLALAPGHPYAIGNLFTSALAICDWAEVAKCAEHMPAQIRAGTSNIDPLRLLAYSDDPSLHLACAQNHFRAQMAELPPPLWQGAMFRHDRIRLAYLSADFHPHPVMRLMSGVFEHHDRTQFETFAISYGRDDSSAVRARAIAAFDHFHQVRAKSDKEVAALLQSLEIDIAVDLHGYTGNERPGILAYRPCPIQVSYLGYASTQGVECLDYMFADPVILPFDQQPYVTENIVHLPECYFVNDAKFASTAETPTREQAGLPASGFVFCCSNSAYKITAPVFEVWMRLLQRVEGSVLWLLKDDAVAEENLRKAAAAHGVDPVRLIFAPRTTLPLHHARHRLADLFLDTLPYNAHTTASDALWSGLPVLTCRGTGLVSRVAASLNHAVGLDDLVTASFAEYEALALRLASDAPLLRKYRDILERTRPTSALFDFPRFCRHLESGYVQMWQRWQRGEPPQAFAVERLPA